YERADLFGEVQGEHLRDASAHGRAVDGGPIHAEVVEHLGGVGGETRGRQLIELTAAAARASVVEGDGAPPRFEVLAQTVPPFVGVRLSLEQEERGSIVGTADLDREREAIACADPVSVPRLHPCSPACDRSTPTLVA